MFFRPLSTGKQLYLATGLDLEWKLEKSRRSSWLQWISGGSRYIKEHLWTSEYPRAVCYRLGCRAPGSKAWSRQLGWSQLPQLRNLVQKGVQSQLRSKCWIRLHVAHITSQINSFSILKPVFGLLNIHLLNGKLQYWIPLLSKLISVDYF